jgi:hypothetical protein
MPQPLHVDEEGEELTFPVKLPDHLREIRRHLKEILEGEAFRGSNRSGQFLKYIVEETISGRQENLRERILGIEIFGRLPSYDTGEDAIVRVTASDVRKRLLRHYGRSGATVDFRFSLPPGSYVPRITRERSVESHPSFESSPSEASSRVQALTPDQTTVAAPASPPFTGTRGNYLWPLVAAALFVSTVVLGFLLWQHVRSNSNRLAFLVPWSAIISGSNPTMIITSDPNIAEIQGFTGGPISLSDYANHKYVPHPELLTPEQNRFCNVILRGDKASTVDTPIVALAAGIAAERSRSVDVRGARLIQLSDIENDKNLIVLGSSRSNPWVKLFNERLDFRFEFDPSTTQEIIRNTHPRTGEAATYVATAPGWATGESYALIALLRNPNGNGRVLLIGGENGEGTEAAGKLLGDESRLRSTLAKCGLNQGATGRNFEILLHLNTLAGSPSNVDAIACHII